MWGDILSTRSKPPHLHPLVNGSQSEYGVSNKWDTVYDASPLKADDLDKWDTAHGDPALKADRDLEQPPLSDQLHHRHLYAFVHDKGKCESSLPLYTQFLTQEQQAFSRHLMAATPVPSVVINTMTDAMLCAILATKLMLTVTDVSTV